jgi:hypothetical protein
VNTFYLFGQSTSFTGYASDDIDGHAEPQFIESSSDQATLFTLDATCSLLAVSGTNSGGYCGVYLGNKPAGPVQCFFPYSFFSAPSFARVTCTFDADADNLLQCTGGPVDLLQSLERGDPSSVDGTLWLGSIVGPDGSSTLDPDGSTFLEPVVLSVMLQ